MEIKGRKDIKEEDLIKMEFIHNNPSSIYLRNNQITKLNGKEYLIRYKELYYTDKKSLINDIAKGNNITIYDFAYENKKELEAELEDTHNIIRHTISKIKILEIKKIIKSKDIPLLLEEKTTGENK